MTHPLHDQYQSREQISFACSELFEYLLRRTYEEENPFERFADVGLQMYGPNTLENSLAIEERELRECPKMEQTAAVLRASAENDILFMKDASSTNSVNIGSDIFGNFDYEEERHCYTQQQCLCGVICNNLRKYIQSVSSLCPDDEAFDNEYLEMLRSFDDEGLVADSDSDWCLPVEEHVHGMPEGLSKFSSHASTHSSHCLQLAGSHAELAVSKENILRCMCGQGDIKFEGIAAKVSSVYDACAKLLSIILTMHTLYIMKYVIFNLVYRHLAMN